MPHNKQDRQDPLPLSTNHYPLRRSRSIRSRSSRSFSAFRSALVNLRLTGAGAALLVRAVAHRRTDVAAAWTTVETVAARWYAGCGVACGGSIFVHRPASTGGAASSSSASFSAPRPPAAGAAAAPRRPAGHIGREGPLPQSSIRLPAISLPAWNITPRTPPPSGNPAQPAGHRQDLRDGSRQQGRHREPAGPHVHQQPRADRAEDQDVDGDPPERAVAQQRGARQGDHCRLERLAEAGRLVGGHQQPAAGGPEPDAVSPLVVVGAVAADGVDQDRHNRRRQQQQRRKPAGEAPLGGDVQCGQLGSAGARPARTSRRRRPPARRPSPHRPPAAAPARPAGAAPDRAPAIAAPGSRRPHSVPTSAAAGTLPARPGTRAGRPSCTTHRSATGGGGRRAGRTAGTNWRLRRTRWCGPWQRWKRGISL